MTFVQLEFLWFLLAVFAAYWVLPRRGQNVLLLIASFVFYGWVHPWFVGLLLYSSVLDWACSNAMAVWPERKRRFLWVSILGNALLLGAFKYLDFFIENVAAALSLVGLGADLHVLGILLPVGISFYTFQTLSYTVDVYRGALKPERSFATFLCYVSFFPQLVAGPIERATRLLPQFHRDRTLDWERFRSGISLALWGVTKKVIVADTLAPYVNAIYAVDEPSNAMAWAAAFGFMLQMLADFSGYTDIARGVARLLGFELTRNFDHPYLARSPDEFWRRWHISFSDWLRDYIFFPLYDWAWGRRWLRIPGVPDDTRSRIARAALLTMLFSGLWHGAAWNFVLWGAFWGVLQVGWSYLPKAPKAVTGHPLARPGSIGLMLAINLVAHQLFREPVLSRLPSRLLGNPFAGSYDELVVAALMLTMALAGAAFLNLAMLFELFVWPRVKDHPVALPIETTLWCLGGWAAFTFARQTQADFLYFAF
jgi:alginate O-acetyltransferase complex protein AlgI